MIAEKAAKYHGINTMTVNLNDVDGATILQEFLSAVEDTGDGCVLVMH